MILGVVCLLAAGGFAIRNKLQSDQAGREAAAALEEVQVQINNVIAEAIAQGQGTPGVTPGQAQPGQTRPEGGAGKDPIAESIPEETQDWSDWPEYGTPMPVVTASDMRFIGILQIPDLELELPVIADFSYALLEISACLFDGNVMNDDMMIAGHNFPSHFAYLKNLKPGAQAIFIDASGRRWEYVMTGSTSMDRSQNLVMYGGEWDLTLFTCVPNTTNRVGVRFKRVYPGYESRHVDKTQKKPENLEVP